MTTNKDEIAALEKKANDGDAKAQYALGVMYDKGVGLPENDCQAARHYKLAADKGYAEAQFNLASLFDSGRNVPEEYSERPENLYSAAAKQGHAKAQYAYGMRHYKGEGVGKQDYSKAYVWLSLAVANGCEEATEDRQAAREKLEKEALSKAQDEALKRWKEMQKKQ
jgi:TPR repeat protein